MLSAPVSSLARPGGNITGISAQSAELVAKGVEILRELLPAGRVLGAFSHGGDPFAAIFIADAERMARSVVLSSRRLTLPAAPISTKRSTRPSVPGLRRSSCQEHCGTTARKSRD